MERLKQITLKEEEKISREILAASHIAYKIRPHTENLKFLQINLRNGINLRNNIKINQDFNQVSGCFPRSKRA